MEIFPAPALRTQDESASPPEAGDPKTGREMAGDPKTGREMAGDPKTGREMAGTSLQVLPLEPFVQTREKIFTPMNDLVGLCARVSLP